MMISRSDVEAAQLLLGLDGQPITPDNISMAYKRLAKEHHPDMGGDAAQFVALDRAKHLLLKFLEKGPPPERPQFKRTDCPNCLGKGRLVLRRGFAQIPITCGRCKGSGDAGWESDVVEG